MKPFLILVSVFTLTIIGQHFLKKSFQAALAGRWAMAAMLIFMASRHFLYTEALTTIVPDFLPQHAFIIYLSGTIQFMLGVSLLYSRIKIAAGWLVMLFFIIIIPSNIKASLENINFLNGESFEEDAAHVYLLIPLHLFYVFWVYFSTVGDEQHEEIDVQV